MAEMNKRRKLRDMLDYENVEADESGNTGPQDEDWLSDLPSDTMAAVLLFKGMMTGGKISTRAIVLKAHVYSVIRNRTTVDRELDQLRLSRQLRMLKIPNDLDDFAVMLWSDYEETVNEAIEASSATAADPRPPSSSTPRATPAAGRSASAAGATPTTTRSATTATTSRPAAAATTAATTATTSRPATTTGSRSASSTSRAPQSPPPKGTLILRHFRDVALPSCLDMVVTKDTLGHLLPQAPADPPLDPPAPAPTPAAPRAVSLTGRATLDEYTGHLLAAGFLARDPVRPDTFQFCVPGLGSTLQQVRGGREELLGWLRRRRYREAAEKDVLALRLRSSRLGPAFHIRDLLGTGAVVQLKTTTGAVYKVAVHKG